MPDIENVIWRRTASRRSSKTSLKRDTKVRQELRQQGGLFGRRSPSSSSPSVSSPSWSSSWSSHGRCDAPGSSVWPDFAKNHLFGKFLKSSDNFIEDSGILYLPKFWTNQTYVPYFSSKCSFCKTARKAITETVFQCNFSDTYDLVYYLLKQQQHLGTDIYWAIYYCSNILLCETSVFAFKMANQPLVKSLISRREKMLPYIYISQQMAVPSW